MLGLTAFLVVVALVAMFIGSVVLIVRAFQTSVLWGLAYLFVPFAALVFVVKYWDETKKPFAILMSGLGILLLAVLITPDRSPVEAETVATEKKPSTSFSTEDEMARLNVPAYEPAPAPRRPVDVEPVAEVKPAKKFEQVWADTATRTYYPESCKKTPPNAYKVAKSVITAQGFTAAACP